MNPKILFTTRTTPIAGHSSPPYSSLNLATQVGDISEHVLKNRTELENQIGRPIQFLEQVHGNQVASIEKICEPPIADAAFTRVKGIALAVMVADCVPILFTSDEVVGVAHVGRRGLVNGVIAKVAAVLKNISPTNLAAHVGPHICPSCYEISSDLANEISQNFPEVISQSRWGTPSIDLRSSSIRQLQIEEIETNDLSHCTYEDENLFSYRRDQKTGRNAGIVWFE